MWHRSSHKTIIRRWKVLAAFFIGLYTQNFLFLIYNVPTPKDDAVVAVAHGGSSAVERESWETYIVPPPNAKSIILNILVDDNGSCPDNCVFIHKFLPQWLQFRYIVFSNKGKHNIEDINNHHAGLNAAMENKDGHVLIVARYNVVEIARWAKHYKTVQKNAVSVGMFLMGDEELLRHNKLMSANLYSNFDYVLRNYYFNASQIGDISLRFLGNATCGSSLPLPSPSTEPGPRWGLHWVFLQPHESHILLDRSLQSIEPAYMRPKNCTFIGWMGGNRDSKEDRAQVRKLSFRSFKDLNCNIALSGAFGTNKYNHSKFWYLNNDLAQSKIGFNPVGVHPECHRLPEMLSLGTVPAMTQQEYMQYTFEPIPGIIGNSWNEVFSKMRYYLGSDGIEELSALSYKSAVWMQKLQACIQHDMNMILSGAFGL